MAEEAPAVAETEDTPQPEAEAPEEGTPETEGETQAPEDYKQRYEDLRPEYTRATQEAAQFRAIVDAARNPKHPSHSEALEYLGFEVGENEEDPEYLDETEELRAELDAIKGRLSEQDETAKQEAFVQAEAEYLDNRISELEKKEGREFTDHEAELLVAAAVANRAEDGEPQVEVAFEALKSVLDESKERWVQSKRTPQAPSGASASQKIDLDDAEQRREYIARRMAESQEPA